jgi:hypothetical protein
MTVEIAFHILEKHNRQLFLLYKVKLINILLYHHLNTFLIAVVTLIVGIGAIMDTTIQMEIF